MNLKKNQHTLFKLITAPEGVHKELKRKPTKLPILGDKLLSAADRLDIYANMYFYRIRDSLMEDFPAIVRAIGDKHFHNLITDYLLKHPSTHFSLRNAGNRLTLFLKKHSLIKTWPYLSDLAKLEWASIEAFDAADVTILTQNDLMHVNPDDWGSLRLSLIPAAQIVEVNTKIAPLLAKKKLSKILKEKNSVLIWRKDNIVLFRSLNPLEAQLLKGVQKQKTFAQLCEIAKDPGLVASCLKQWLDDKLLKNE